MQNIKMPTPLLILAIVVFLNYGCKPRYLDNALNSPLPGVSPLQLTDESFEQQVIHSEIPVLVDMWAPWCSPCLRMKPTVHLLAEELAMQVKVAELNVDENLFTVEKYSVNQYPTVLIFKDGLEVRRLVGMKTRRELIAALEL